MSIFNESGRFLFCRSFLSLFMVMALWGGASVKGDPIPFEIKITPIPQLAPGAVVTVPVIKTLGTEEIRGFDFMIGFPAGLLTITAIESGILFDIPGDYEWEYFSTEMGPFPGCYGGCPTGMVNILAIADANDGSHHPKNDPATGRIKIIPDELILLTITFTVAQNLPPQIDFLPVEFFWNNCAVNGLAFTYRTDNPFNVLQGNSRGVHSFDGTAYNEITDTVSELPTGTGMPYDCLAVCGDCDGDRVTNILDIMYLVNYKFKGGPDPFPLVAADVNADGSVDVLDIIYYIDYKFKGGQPLVCKTTNVRLVDFYNGAVYTE